MTAEGMARFGWALGSAPGAGVEEAVPLVFLSLSFSLYDAAPFVFAVEGDAVEGAEGSRVSWRTSSRTRRRRSGKVETSPVRRRLSA